MFAYINRYIISLAIVIGLVTAGCGENTIILDDPNALDPNIPIVDVEADDYIQQHLRSYDQDGVKMTLKDDVKILTPYQLQHLKAVNDRHTVLTFEGDLSRLPKVGDKIVYSPYTMGDVTMLTPACSGKVESVIPSSRANSYDVCLEETATIGLSEFYDELEMENVPIVFRKVRADDYVERDFRATIISHEGSLSNNFLPDKYPFAGGFDLVGHTELGIQGNFSASKQEDFFDINIQPILKLQGDIGFKAGVQMGFDNARLESPGLPVIFLGGILVGPVPVLFTLDINCALYPIVEATAKISAVINIDRVLADWHLSYRKGRFVGSFEKPKMNEIEGWTVFDSFKQVEVEGKVGFGFRIYPTICVDQIKMADADIIYCDVNLNLNSEYSVRLDKPAETDMLHNPILLGVEGGAYYKVNFNPFNLGDMTFDGEIATFSHTIKELYLPPTYTQWSHSDNVKNRTTLLSAMPTGDLLLPIKTGFTLYTGVKPAEINAFTSILESRFSSGPSYPSWAQTFGGAMGSQVSVLFSGLNEGQTYTAIPYIGFFDESFNMPVYGDNYYTFTFGKESPSHLLKSISIPYVGGDFIGGSVEMNYDDTGRLIQYNDPMTGIRAQIDYDDKVIRIDEDDPEPVIWSDIRLNANGYITGMRDSGGNATVSYSDGFISHIAGSDGETVDFEWSNGKLLSVTIDDHDTDHHGVTIYEYLYDKEVSNRQNQIWYISNQYFFLFHAGLFGKKPLYLPTGVKTTQKDIEGTDVDVFDVSFDFDSDGYITRENTKMYGLEIPFDYTYE